MRGPAHRAPATPPRRQVLARAPGRPCRGPAAPRSCGARGRAPPPRLRRLAAAAPGLLGNQREGQAAEATLLITTRPGILLERPLLPVGGGPAGAPTAPLDRVFWGGLGAAPAVRSWRPPARGGCGRRCGRAATPLRPGCCPCESPARVSAAAATAGAAGDAHVPGASRV